MENMDVLVRGVVMQNPGLGLGLINFAGLEWAWFVVVATIVVAFVSVRRVSIVSVGLTWRGKPGQVRVRVQSFSSSSDGNCIVTASGMFSAELVKSSADVVVDDQIRCSESARSDAASKLATEMVFIFEKKTTSVVLPKPPNPATRTTCEKGVKRRRKVLASTKSPKVVYSDSQPTEGQSPVSRREGIEWDPGTVQPVSNVDILLPLWAQAFTKVTTCPTIPTLRTSSSEWDPLLKLRMHDSILRGNRKRFPVENHSLSVAPVAKGLDEVVTLKNDVVRLWDADTKFQKKRVPLPKCHDLPVSAFDVDWDSKVAAVGRVGGLLSLVNLEYANYERGYQTKQSLVQALQIDKSSPSKSMFVGGPKSGSAGCSVSLWDTRTNNRQLNVSLRSATTIYGLQSKGQELYVRDELNSLSAHDVRMLRPANLRRIACDATIEGAEEKWWDIDTSLDFVEKDVEDDFWDCQTAEEAKGGGASLMGSLVQAVSRSFSSKSLGR